jgi:hypothetical protein
MEEKDFYCLKKKMQADGIASTSGKPIKKVAVLGGSEVMP